MRRRRAPHAKGRAGSGVEVSAREGEVVRARAVHHELVLEGSGPKPFVLEVAHAGRFALFTEHLPEEFDTTVRTLSGAVVTAASAVVSLEEHILVSQHQPRIERFVKRSEVWLAPDVAGAHERIALVSARATLEVDEIYEGLVDQDGRVRAADEHLVSRATLQRRGCGQICLLFQ